MENYELSESEILKISKQQVIGVFENIFEDLNVTQIGNYEWVIPTIVDNETRYVRVSFTTAKRDFDIDYAVEKFEREKAGAELRERERKAKKLEAAQKLAESVNVGA